MFALVASFLALAANGAGQSEHLKIAQNMLFAPPGKPKGHDVLCKLPLHGSALYVFSGVPKGRYRLWWSGSYGPDHGKFQLTANGTGLRIFDAWYYRWAPTGWRDMGECKVNGDLQLEFYMQQKNPRASADFLECDSIVLEPLESK